MTFTISILRFIATFAFLAIFPYVRSFGWDPPAETHITITENGLRMVLEQFFKYKPTNIVNCILIDDSYRGALKEMLDANKYIDDNVNTYLTAHLHFDSESFADAADTLKDRRGRAKVALQENDTTEARSQIGMALHTVQDFYAHSNWVEMGRRDPSPGTLGRPGSDSVDFGAPLSEPWGPACRPCDDSNGCMGNVITDKLTSGYFTGSRDASGRFISRPTWKCHHGGSSDLGVREDPAGGIDKDNDEAPHGPLHRDAAKVAEFATAHFFMDIGREIGDEKFFLLLGITEVSNITTCDVTSAEVTQIYERSSAGSSHSKFTIQSSIRRYSVIMISAIIVLCSSQYGG